MASSRLSRTLFCFVLILLFVTSRVMQMSEARKLGEKVKPCTKKCVVEKPVTSEENGTVNPSKVPVAATPGVKIMEGGDLDAFRPTQPGHSPGVGSGKASEVVQMNEARKVGENFKCSGEKCMVEKAVTEENGGGNASRVPVHGVEIMEGDVDGFRPTQPGHSPGVGHSIHN
ncbi:hypothetical protein OSB04_000071 [Centaurea solstitialis]|uniref:Uncharacterized protein n=1 Tax=Centaurea solstitialis TaxID=347529 RepID=A0AA38TNC2_9ASTR|nr:hypothetical protein OSB04_000071 [Centaurea solstitialis]